MKIAIDGPAGVGKSTVAKFLAKEFNLTYINTGAMYRGIAYMMEKYPDFNLKNISMDFVNNRLVINGEDVTDNIFNKNIDLMSSKVSQDTNVRKVLTSIQKEMVEKYDGVVMEGRDIGTVVMPKADFKFFLTASVDERARRRFLQNKEKGLNPDLEEIRDSIIKRDYEDINRKLSPLKKAEDAIEIDTTNLSLNEVINKISKYIGGKNEYKA